MIIDNFNISDGLGPHGFVIIKDQNSGKILFKGHNMIVRDGRNYLFYKFIKDIQTNITNPESASNNGFTISSDFSKFEGYYLGKYAFGTNMSEVAFDDTSIDKLEDISGNITVDNIGEIGNSDDESMLMEHPYIKFSFKDITLEISNTDTGTDTINELGLYLLNVNSEEIIINGVKQKKYPDILFSRIRLDSIPFNATTEFSLDYYIYF